MYPDSEDSDNEAFRLKAKRALKAKDVKKPSSPLPDFHQLSNQPRNVSPKPSSSRIVNVQDYAGYNDFEDETTQMINAAKKVQRPRKFKDDEDHERLKVLKEWHFPKKVEAETGEIPDDTKENVEDQTSARDGGTSEALPGSSRPERFKKPPNHSLIQDKIRISADATIREEDRRITGPHLVVEKEIVVQGGGGEAQHAPIKEMKDARCLFYEVVKNLEKMKIETASQIQEYVLPILINSQKDLVAYTATGRGKTLSYIIAVVSIYARKNRIETVVQRLPRVFILFHTHECALQVYNLMHKIANGLELTILTTLGCVNKRQELQKLKQDGGDIFISTTGRLIDLLSNGEISIAKTEIIIFDEAEKFLDDSSWHKTMKWFSDYGPQDRRTLLFSATSNERTVSALKNFVRPDHWFVRVGKINKVVSQVKQSFIESKEYLFSDLLIRLLISKAKNNRCPKTIIFANNIDVVEFLACRLRMFRDIVCPFSIRVASLHSKNPACDREKVLNSFGLPPGDPGSLDVLVGSDKIGEGVDTPAELIINYELPFERSIHIKRVGRTGRNGHVGEAFTFVDPDLLEHMKHHHKEQACKIFIEAYADKPNERMPPYMQNFIQNFVQKYGPIKDDVETDPTR